LRYDSELFVRLRLEVNEFKIEGYMSDQNTKEKILKTARILFADHGFEGTSIRDIAKAADVNVASVNYHFSSKENLFIEIIAVGYRECSEEMRSFIDTHKPNLEDALIYLFRHFLSKSHDLVSSFKLMMSVQHNHHAVSQGTEDEFFGPPGGKAIGEAIVREVGSELSESDLHFALKTLFGHVTHQALIYHCLYKLDQGHGIPFSTIADLEYTIRRLSGIIIKELREKT
jgi:AcrR family transcriptional regulator